jgi:large subunit ribosomal protein L24
MASTGTKRAKIRKGDQVIVIAGRDKGKRGRILEVLPSEGKVRVEGVAIVKRHQRPNPQKGTGGGIVEKEALINISNVQMIDSQTGKGTRVRYLVNEDGGKTRIAARSGNTLDKG